jgi:hypothetical protein
MMEAASTSETSVNFCQTTWRNIPEDSHLRDHFSPYPLKFIANLRTGFHYTGLTHAVDKVSLYTSGMNQNLFLRANQGQRLISVGSYKMHCYRS